VHQNTSENKKIRVPLPRPQTTPSADMSHLGAHGASTVGPVSNILLKCPGF